MAVGAPQSRVSICNLFLGSFFSANKTLHVGDRGHRKGTSTFSCTGSGQPKGLAVTANNPCKAVVVGIKSLKLIIDFVNANGTDNKYS